MESDKAIKTIFHCFKIVTIILCFTLFVTACQLDEGIVYKKEFRPTKDGYITETKRKPRSHGRTPLEIKQQKRVRYPDRWVLYVHSESNNDSTHFFVDKELYDKTKLGDKFVFDAKKASRKEPYKKIQF